eukprot:COSAG02_NODE_29788_length_563_cov_0.644397_2_plen_96_part_01
MQLLALVCPGVVLNLPTSHQRHSELPTPSAHLPATQLCLAGRYSRESRSSCYGCPSGKFSAQAGQTSVAACVTCDAGKATNVRTGAVSCEVCDAGW